MIENLVKPSTYAKIIGTSRQWVYQLIEQGKIVPILIDGVTFIDKKKYENI